MIDTALVRAIVAEDTEALLTDKLVLGMADEIDALRIQVENAKEAMRLIKRSISIPPTGGFRKFLKEWTP